MFIALAVTGVVILSRIFWGELTVLLIRLIDRREVQRERRVNWRQRFVTAWAGFRGAVSLAAALAVPTTTLSGAPFPDRSLLIFIVVVVILVTVLVQGSTLPAVVRWAKMPEDVAHAEELQLARTRGVQAALDALPAVADEVGIGDDLRRRLQKEYEEKAALALATEDGSTNSHLVKSKDQVRRVRLGVLDTSAGRSPHCETRTSSTTSCCASCRTRWTSRKCNCSTPPRTSEARRSSTVQSAPCCRPWRSAGIARCAR